MVQSLAFSLLKKVRIIILSFIFLISASIAKSQVVINELGIAPTTGNGAGGGEFIELFNRGSGNVDISCYVIVFTGSSSAQAWTISIPSNTILSCGQYYLIGGAGKAPSPNSAWVNTIVGGNPWINNYSTNGLNTITAASGLNINAAGCSGKGNLPPGNLADAQGQVSLLTATGALVASVAYNNGNYTSIYSGSFSNPSTSCTAINPIPTIPNSTFNVNSSFSGATTQGIYLDQNGNYQTETTLTPGKSNALNTFDGATQISSNCCINPTITTQPATATQTLCLNTPATALSIVATAGSGTISSYQWYSNSIAANSGGTIITGANAASYTPPTTTIGTSYYYCVVTNSNGCSTTSNVSGAVIVNALPVVPALTKVDPTCVTSGSITVTSPLGAGFSYSIDGTNFQASPVFTSGISAGNYTITVKNSNGCINTGTTTINPVPSAPAAAVFTITQPTCTVATGTISITTVSGITYSIDGVSFSATPSFTNLVPNTYTITAKNSSGCITTTNATINAQPATPAAPTLAVVDNCGNSTLTASGVTGALIWSDAGTGNPRTVTTAASYTVTQTVNGCTSAASNSVTSAPKTIPSAPTLAVVDNCGSSTLTASGVTGTLTWSDAGTGNPRTVTTAASYTVTQIANGCTSAASNSVTSAPKAIPSAPILSIVDSCGNSTITASGVVGTLTWSDAGTGNPRTVTTAASYTVTQTVNGCISVASNSVTSAPKTIPVAPTVTTPVTYCQNATASALTATGSNLLWYGTAATGGTASGTAPTPVTTAGGSTNYYVSQTVGSCESPRAAINVIIVVTPAPTVVSPIVFCLNATATALTATGSNLLWYGTAATGGTGSTTAPTPPTTTAGTTNYYVSQTASGCESPRAAIAVTIEAFSITLNANPNPASGGVAFTGQITGNLPIASSVWQPSNLFVNNLSTQTIIAPDTSFTLVVTGVSANGCRSTVSKLITVIPSNNTIFIPNALTPAAIGTDASVVKVYGNTAKTATMLVYNQWGQLIFQSDNATTKGWDGTFNGKAQPSGVYTYVVRVVYQNNKVETRSGSINLIR